MAIFSLRVDGSSFAFSEENAASLPFFFSILWATTF